MKLKYVLAAAAAAAALSACGKAQQSADETALANRAQPGLQQVYSGTGKISAITGNQVTIDHGPIAGIGWPAMTMTFTAPTGMVNGVKVGTDVDFSFRKSGSAYVLTSVKPR